MDSTKSKDFPLFVEDCAFTDDSVLTLALADAILSGTPYADNSKRFNWLYPRSGYGSSP